MPLAQQLPNPIAVSERDNNGAIIAFPASNVPPTGAATLAGTLTFGIGTQANNAFANATTIGPTDEGQFTTVIGGQTLTESFLDTGTPYYAFPDTALPQCTDTELMGFLCPTTPVMLMAVDYGGGDASASVSFTVASADALENDASVPFAVFPDLGVDVAVFNGGSFDWGFPFFIGRQVYVG